MSNKRKGIYKHCKNCGKKFYVRKSREKIACYCSRACADVCKSGRPPSSTIRLICQQCGKEIFVIPSQKNRQFCSRECRTLSQRGKPFGPRNVTHPKVKVICEQCEKVMMVSYARAKKFRFCSKKCQSDYRRGRSRIDARAGKTLICEECGREFYVNQWQIEHGRRFCSKECRGAWLGRKQNGKDHPGWNSEERKCQVCGDLFYISDAELEKGRRADREWGIYCSRNCQNVGQSGENAPNWQGGLSFEPYPPEFNDRLKEQIRQRDQGLCVRCKEPGIDVHHIDYDKDNSDPSNLVLLCKSCHGQTNGDRDMWTQVFQWYIGNLTLGYELNNSPIRDCILQNGGIACVGLS